MSSRPQHHQELKGYLFAIGATVVWSGNFVVARGLNESIHPISLAFCRWSVAVIVFLPFALKSLIKEWSTIRENILYLSITSLLGITIFNTLIYFAGHTTTAINLSLIALTFPIFVIILSRIFLHELMTTNKGIGISLVMMGVLLLVSKGNLSNLINIYFAIGDFWMLMAAFIFAIHTMLIKNKPKQLSVLAFQSSTFILGLIFLSPFFIWEQMTSPPIIFTTTTVLSILYIGICASLIAFVMWNNAILMVTPTKAAMIYYTLPVFSAILAHFILKETISRFHLYSVLLIVSGIITANRKSRRPDKSLETRPKNIE